MRRAVAVLCLLAAAGCIESAPPGDATVNDVAPSATILPDAATAHLAPDSGASEPGSPVAPAASAPAAAPVPVLAAGRMLRWEGTCPCDPLQFDLDVEGEWDGWLEVRVQWDGTQVPDVGLRLDGPFKSIVGDRGFDDRLARLFGPEAGRHQVALDGSGSYTAVARLGSTRVPDAGALLPNLVELVVEGPHVDSCDEVEQTEQGAVTCMRFGNGVGNPGHGPVQIRLTVDQAILALAPLDGRFSQEIRNADGSVDSHVVGPAEFHLTHGHWHYDGLAHFDLFAFDEATGLRGALASSHGKSGFCFLDWDQMPEPVTEPAAQERAETDCLVPGTAGSWTNGISRGWYDFYYYGLTDQYVDIAEVPDGTYELVASADPLQTLDELDETDNQSSLLLSIAGTNVEVLEERGHYRVQDADDA
ncbi:MAG: lysyl oxidase family protein [Candidatus Thermoplasmatota archaeon]|mgnify:CR=1 FL=1